MWSKVKNRNSIFTLIDIGSSKFICIVARAINANNFEILGITHQASAGIKSGLIVDPIAFEESIARLIDKAENATNERISKVYVCLSSHGLISMQASAQVDIGGRQIMMKDLLHLLDIASEQSGKNEHKFEDLHSFVYNYTIDNSAQVLDPLAMYADKLAAKIHFISSPLSILLNFSNYFAKCGLEVQNYICSAYATGLGVLTEDELQTGATLIEIGAHTSSIAIFIDGHMIWLEHVPIGAQSITQDIARGLGLNFYSAERLKNLYGSLLPNSETRQEIIEIVDNTDDLTSVQVEIALLSEIIEARIEELFSLLTNKMKEKHIIPPQRFVLCGGGARLQGIVDFVANFFGVKARLGIPNSSFRLKQMDESNNVELATAIGGLIHIMENYYSPKKKQQTEEALSNDNMFLRIIQKIMGD